MNPKLEVPNVYLYIYVIVNAALVTWNLFLLQFIKQMLFSIKV